MIKYFFIFSISFTSFFYGQTFDDFSIHKKEYHFDKKTERDPQLLVATLTKNKSSEQEKFNAIYAWVATNISYSYRQYYSPSGTFSLPTKYILKTKHAVCLGYANLMDTLCGIAGITNTSVYGYAKDPLIFDVNDSIYTSNHAWNAVKLDGLWYLYDITWSTGTSEYKYTRFSNLILHLLEKHKKKLKQVRIGSKTKTIFKNECRDTSSPAYYYRQKFFNKKLRGFLSSFKIKINPTYDYKFNLTYYLSQPEVFAINHYPDNPIWALGADKPMHGFEGDSAYYFLNDSILANQQRGGRACAACDAYLDLPLRKKIKEYETKSFAFNTKNQSIITDAEFDLCKLNYKDALAEPVDTVKIIYLDSAKINCTALKRSLQTNKKNNGVEFRLQKNKNKRKLTLLITENKQHKLFIRKKVKQSINQMRIYKEVGNKSDAFSRTYREKALAVARIKTNFKTFEPPQTKRNRIDSKIYKLKLTKEKLDILYADITDKEQQFDSIIENLSLNIWQQSFGLDSLSAAFSKRIKLRRHAKDNYKKSVEDIRKKINSTEFNYRNSLDYLVYDPAKKASNLFNYVCRKIKLKNKLEQDALNYQREIVKVQADPMSELVEYKNFVIDGRKKDYCWLDNNYAKVTAVHLGFIFLHNQQDDIDLYIISENDTERDRYAMVDKELKRRYRQSNSIVGHNLHLQLTVSKKLRTYKRKVQKDMKAKK